MQEIEKKTAKNNNIEHVRALLIQGMEELLNPEEETTFNTDKADSLAKMASVIVESVKAETSHVKTMHAAGMRVQGTSFIPDQIEDFKPIQEQHKKLQPIWK